MRCVMKLGFLVALVVGLQFGLSSALMADIVHDLATDYQLTSNPSLSDHGWKYDSNGSLITNHGTYAYGEWGTTQAWCVPSTPWLGWAKVTDNPSSWDALLGDIVTHEGSPTQVSYTFAGSDLDASGFATISGELWNTRNAVTGHSSIRATWNLYKNTTLLSTGTVWGHTPRSDLADNSLATGSGGAAALENIPYVAGDTFRLEMIPQSVGDYRGVVFTITTTVPEPSMLALLFSGLFGLLAYAWRKRK